MKHSPAYEDAQILFPEEGGGGHRFNRKHTSALLDCYED